LFIITENAMPFGLVFYQLSADYDWQVNSDLFGFKWGVMKMGRDIEIHLESRLIGQSGIYRTIGSKTRRKMDPPV